MLIQNMIDSKKKEFPYSPGKINFEIKSNLDQTTQEDRISVLEDFSDQESRMEETQGK